MKKKTVVLIGLILLLVIALFAYRSYAVAKTNDYIKSLEGRLQRAPVEFDIKGGIQIERIIKRTPWKLAMVIKWGEDERAFVYVEHWMTRQHDYIEINPVEKGKRVVIFE